MDNKTKIIITLGSIGTCGLFYMGYKLYKFGFDQGAKSVGEKLFNGDLTVEETDEDGNVTTKVVDPVLRRPEDVIIDDYESVGVVHR